MSDLTITHTRADGTLLHGSAKGDGVYQVIRAVHGHWRPFRSLGCLGLVQTRDKPARRPVIDATAAALREAGHTVTVEVDDTTPGRDFATAEAGRYDRAAGRASRHPPRCGSRGAPAAGTTVSARTRRSGLRPSWRGSGSRWAGRVCR